MRKLEKFQNCGENYCESGRNYYNILLLYHYFILLLTALKKLSIDFHYFLYRKTAGPFKIYCRQIFLLFLALFAIFRWYILPYVYKISQKKVVNASRIAEIAGKSAAVSECVIFATFPNRSAHFFGPFSCTPDGSSFSFSRTHIFHFAHNTPEKLGQPKKFKSAKGVRVYGFSKRIKSLCYGEYTRLKQE